MELAIVFGGVIVSLIVQGIKKYFGTSEYVTIASAVVLSLVGAFGFWYLKNADLLRSALEVFTIAGAFYAYIIKRF